MSVLMPAMAGLGRHQGASMRLRSWLGGMTVVLAATGMAGAADPAPAAAPEASSSSVAVRIGYVDLQRALNESTAGKKAKGDFQVKVQGLEGQLKGQKEELDRMRDDLQKKGAVMREEERRKLETEFEHKRLDLKRRFEDSQAELQRKDAELSTEIIGTLQGIIGKIGKARGYTVILELNSSAVLYYQKSDDITAEVITAYDAQS